jgi:acyl dehydratase
LGSPSAGEVHWLKPVRAGDELWVRIEILEARRSESKPDRGVVRAFVEVLNQDREVVMTREALGLVRCRATA